MAGKSLSERTVEDIFTLISHTPLDIGSKLPNENELSQRFGVSRATLREAIRFLVAQGVLEVRRGSGTFVISSEAPSSGCDFAAIERTRVQARDLFEVRLMFEPQVAAMVCQRASEDELREIEKCAAKVASLIDTGGDWPQADELFHTAIVSASHNEFLSNLLPIINRAFAQGYGLLGRSVLELAETVRQDNELLLEALRCRNPIAARAAMEIHLSHVMSALKLPENSGGAQHIKPPIAGSGLTKSETLL